MQLPWWAMVALAISLITGAIGFTGAASGSSLVARVLAGVFFVVFLVLLILALLGVGVAPVAP